MVVTKVVQRDVPVEIRVIGNVDAYATVTVKAQVTGQLIKSFFNEGDFVKKGDPLFTIDPSSFEANVQQIEANLARDQAVLGQAEANLARDAAQQQYAQAQASRYQQLFQQGVISKEQADQYKTNADALGESVRADQAAIASARASVGATQAALRNAKIQLAYTSISSPIDGRTGSLTTKPGNLVTANTTELVTINQVQPINVTFAVPESDLPAIKQHMAGSKLEVIAAPQDNSSPAERGVLTFVDNTVDPSTGTIKLKGTFPNPDRKLWPGEFVSVTLRLAVQPNALVVPNQVVQTSQTGQYVYVVKDDRTVEMRPVVVGQRVNEDLVIRQGLQAGETVVSEGQLRLAPGSRVSYREGRASASPGSAAEAGTPAPQEAQAGDVPANGPPADRAKRGWGKKKGGDSWSGKSGKGGEGRPSRLPTQ